MAKDLIKNNIKINITIQFLISGQYRILETEGPRVRASPASLRCVLKQGH